MAKDDRHLHPVNVRMKNLRLQLGYPKPGKFAQMLGISISRWTNVEGGHPLTHAVAVILKSKLPGLTYDYIYDGDAADLKEPLRGILGEKPSVESVKGVPVGPAYGIKAKGKSNNNDNYRPPRATKRKTGA